VPAKTLPDNERVIPPSPGGFGGRGRKKRGNSRCPALDFDSFLLYLNMITVPGVALMGAAVTSKASKRT
jgi:hypothetical protein